MIGGAAAFARSRAIERIFIAGNDREAPSLSAAALLQPPVSHVLAAMSIVFLKKNLLTV